MDFIKKVFSSVVSVFSASVGRGSGVLGENFLGHLAIGLTLISFLFWTFFLDRKTAFHFRTTTLLAVLFTLVMWMIIVFLSILTEKAR